MDIDQKSMEQPKLINFSVAEILPKADV